MFSITRQFIARHPLFTIILYETSDINQMHMVSFRANGPSPRNSLAEFISDLHSFLVYNNNHAYAIYIGISLTDNMQPKMSTD